MHAQVAIKRIHGEWEVVWEFGKDNIRIGEIRQNADFKWFLRLSPQFARHEGARRVWICRGSGAAKDLAATLVHNRLFPTDRRQVESFLAEE